MIVRRLRRRMQPPLSMGEQPRWKTHLHFYLLPFPTAWTKSSDPLSRQVITPMLVIITSALHLYFLTQRQHLDFHGALKHGVGNVIVCLSILVIWHVSTLLSYHMRIRPHFYPPSCIGSASAISISIAATAPECPH